MTSPDNQAPNAPFTLVLGAGGRVGMASHAGVLKALEEVAGLDPRAADLVIGTSAGSVIGALLRLGWSPSEIWGLVTRTEVPDDPTTDVARSDLFRRSWQGPSQLLRRSMGSAFVIGRSVMRVPLPVPQIAGRLFPGGFMSFAEEEGDVGIGIGEEWPDKPLWLCAVNLDTGRRVVLGRRPEPPPLALAVLASCSIPGYYQPVRIGSQVLVDGGVHSTQNLDLAARADAPLVIASAPMAYDPRVSPGLLGRLTRRPINRGLARHRMQLRSAGKTLLLLRPGPEELRAHGANPMRNHGLEEVAVAAYDATARVVASPRGRQKLAAAPGAGEPIATG